MKIFSVSIVSLALCLPLMAQNSPVPKQFVTLCAGCHGPGGSGGDRGPALTNSRSLRQRSETEVRDIIRNGTPGGMPPFRLPDAPLQELAKWVHGLNASAMDAKPEGDATAGQAFFFGKGQCSTCHMAQGKGTPNGPDLSSVGRQLTLKEISATLENPTEQLGSRSSSTCPGWAFCADEPWAVVTVSLRNGSSLRGFARGQGKHDIQLQTFDGKLHLLTDADYKEVKREKVSIMPPLKATDDERRNLLAYLSNLGGPIEGPITDQSLIPNTAIESVMNPREGEWATYYGNHNGNRYSPLHQITKENVAKLQPKWVYTLPSPGLQTTPLVKDGIMYVTAPGQVCAVDARVGREIWCHTNSGKKTSDPNRGVAILHDRVFYASADAHLICLNRITGAVMWDVKMPDTPGRYSATSAPLIVGDLVISGIAGGDGPLLGFLTAYKATTGEKVWRFWTIPKPGEPGSETWIGRAIATGGGATWVTGSYDAETGTLFWTVGNPYPATDGDERTGSNLYTNCVIALDAKTGKLKWHFQFTPHDLHDWDATEPLLLVNTKYKGRDRKLLLQGNRNGFFYVLDRTNGEFLLGKPFVKKMNWASGIGPDGVPQLLPTNQPTKAGVKTCPAVRGATNWYSTSFHPETRLFYIMAVEDCSIYKKMQDGGYEGSRDPSEAGATYLRAIDIETGKMVWEIPQVGPPESNYSGILTTAGGVLFYGETGGGFAAVDAKTGANLWHFETGQQWRASPITYMLDSHQHIAIAAGGNIMSFALAK